MNCVEYRVVEVDDMPGDHEWMLIDEPDAVTFVVRRGHLTAKVVTEGWAAYREGGAVAQRSSSLATGGLGHDLARDHRRRGLGRQ